MLKQCSILCVFLKYKVERWGQRIISFQKVMSQFQDIFEHLEHLLMIKSQFAGGSGKVVLCHHIFGVKGHVSFHELVKMKKNVLLLF